MTVRIREAVPADLEQLNELYNHYVRTSPVTFDIDEIDMAARHEWFEIFDGARYRLVVALEGDDVVGYAHSKPFRPKQAYETSVEVTCYCRDGEQGKGIGRAMYEHLFALLADQDVHRLLAGITVPNEASFALHEKFGFRQVALFSEQGRKFGKYWDVAWFEKEF